MTTSITPHDIFKPFAFQITTMPRKELRTFLEDIIALKSSDKRYESHIDRWFNKAGLTDADRDVKLARQLATLHYLIADINIFAVQKIAGTYDDADPEFTGAIQMGLKATFLDCANRCGGLILDRERTFTRLILSVPAHSMSGSTWRMTQIRAAAKADKTIYDDLTGKGTRMPSDLVTKYLWSNVVGKTDQYIAGRAFTWFGSTPGCDPRFFAHWGVTEKKPTPTKVGKIGKPTPTKPVEHTKPTPTLGQALTAFDLAKDNKATDLSDVPFHDIRTAPEVDTPFTKAIADLTFHYRNRLVAAGLSEFTSDIIAAGPIVFVKGNFRYDTSWNRDYPVAFNDKSTILIEEANPVQLTQFEKHLEAFDVAFNGFIQTHSRVQAQTKIARGIMSFLNSKKTPN
jgi:hypothetical protein